MEDTCPQEKEEPALERVIHDMQCARQALQQEADLLDEFAQRLNGPMSEEEGMTGCGCGDDYVARLRYENDAMERLVRRIRDARKHMERAA